MKFRLLAAVAALAFGSTASAAPVLAPPAATLGAEVQRYVHLPAGQTAIQHLRIIDGTGAAPIEDATLLIDGAKIAAILSPGSAIPAGYKTLDGTGETALPGLVGMHNHLYYLQLPNLDASGKFLGLRVRTLANMGAYLSTFGPNIPTNLYGLLPSWITACRARTTFR